MIVSVDGGVTVRPMEDIEYRAGRQARDRIMWLLVAGVLGSLVGGALFVAAAGSVWSLIGWVVGAVGGAVLFVGLVAAGVALGMNASKL